MLRAGPLESNAPSDFSQLAGEGVPALSLSRSQPITAITTLNTMPKATSSSQCVLTAACFPGRAPEDTPVGQIATAFSDHAASPSELAVRSQEVNPNRGSCRRAPAALPGCARLCPTASLPTARRCEATASRSPQTKHAAPSFAGRALAGVAATRAGPSARRPSRAGPRGGRVAVWGSRPPEMRSRSGPSTNSRRFARWQDFGAATVTINHVSSVASSDTSIDGIRDLRAGLAWRPTPSRRPSFRFSVLRGSTLLESTLGLTARPVPRNQRLKLRDLRRGTSGIINCRAYCRSLSTLARTLAGQRTPSEQRVSADEVSQQGVASAGAVTGSPTAGRGQLCAGSGADRLPGPYARLGWPVTVNLKPAGRGPALAPELRRSPLVPTYRPVTGHSRRSRYQSATRNLKCLRIQPTPLTRFGSEMGSVPISESRGKCWGKSLSKSLGKRLPKS